MVKRVPEGPVFSKEPVRITSKGMGQDHLNLLVVRQGNLRNLHSYKFSGLANEKVTRSYNDAHELF